MKKIVFSVQNTVRIKKRLEKTVVLWPVDITALSNLHY